MWKGIPGREDRKCKGPGVGLCLVHGRNSDKAGVTGTERSRGVDGR